MYDGSFATRVYAVSARHAQLIEYGHRAVAKGGKYTGKDVKGIPYFWKSHTKTLKMSSGTR